MHVHIVFNGEIYNFKELKQELSKKGFNFYTNSDTEVICAAYICFGKEFLSRLNGMFSFLIYDQKEGILFAAIDRLGKKPFYYLHDSNGFEFASQPSVIRLGRSLDVDHDSINEFLMRGYISSPRSIYSEIKKIQPGYCLTYDLKSSIISLEKYWDISSQGLKTFNDSYDKAINILDRLITDAVGLRMISDVPIGTFLSGGIDSSLITAIAQRISSKPIKTFSIQFEENDFDESIHASKIANYLGTDHTNIVCSINESIKLINSHNYFYDEPFADSSALPSLLLAKHTHQYVTVALSGDGGDESFLGYQRYDWIKILSSCYKLPKYLRITLGKILSLQNNFKLKIIGYKLQNDENVNELIYNFLQTNYPQILNSKIERNAVFNYTYVSSEVVQMAADLDIKLWLAGDGLVKIDRANMAFSVEGRSPLLDYRVLEFARSLPLDFKYKYGNKKRILKDVLSKYIPQNIYDKPKRGFSVPLANWFKNDLKEMVYDTITDKNLGIIPNLNISYVKMGIENHMKNRINFSPEIWKLIVLINWMNENGKN